MPSATKAALLQQQEENEFLNRPAPPLMAQSGRDLRVSQPRREPTAALALAATRALREGQTHYVDVPGIGPLREALAAYLQETFGAGYESNHVLVTAGVQEGRFLTLQKIGELFGGVTIPAVVHPGVRRALGTRSLAVTKMAVDEANGFLPTVDGVRQALADGSRLFYLESPSRLTGKALVAAEIAEIVALIGEHDGGLIVDEGLAPWVARDGFASAAAQDGAVKNVAVLGETWPGMGLDSWFIGFVAAPEAWFEPMRSQKQIMAICTSTAAQFAALEAAQTFAQNREGLLQELSENRRRVSEAARTQGLDVLAGDAQSIVAVRGGAQAGYEAADGADFGAPGVTRLAITIDDTSLQAVQSAAQEG